MDLQCLQPRRTGVCDFEVPTYERRMVTAAARPHIFWVGDDRQGVRGWPIGPALLEALGEINADVQEALADERARLSEHGYSDDLPLPALWWVPSAGDEADAEKALLEAVPVTA
jgi:hypothetical protein